MSVPYPEWPSHIYSKALPESQLFKHLKKFVFECVCTKPGCRRLGNLVGREILLQWFKPGQQLIHSFQFLLVYASINNTWHLKMNVNNVLKLISSGFTYFYYNYVCAYTLICIWMQVPVEARGSSWTTQHGCWELEPSARLAHARNRWTVSPPPISGLKWKHTHYKNLWDREIHQGN